MYTLIKLKPLCVNDFQRCVLIIGSNKINIIFPYTNSEINITYKNWKKINNQYFPMDIELIISNLEVTYKLLINYKNIKFDLPQKFPFKSIDNRYQFIKFND